MPWCLSRRPKQSKTATILWHCYHWLASHPHIPPFPTGCGSNSKPRPSTRILLEKLRDQKAQTPKALVFCHPNTGQCPSDFGKKMLPNSLSGYGCCEFTAVSYRKRLVLNYNLHTWQQTFTLLFYWETLTACAETWREEAEADVQFIVHPISFCLSLKAFKSPLMITHCLIHESTRKINMEYCCQAFFLTCLEHRAEWVFLACDVTWNLAFYSSLRK